MKNTGLLIKNPLENLKMCEEVFIVYGCKDESTMVSLPVSLIEEHLAEKLNTLSKQEKAREGGNSNGKGQRIIAAYRRTEQMW